MAGFGDELVILDASYGLIDQSGNGYNGSFVGNATIATVDGKSAYVLDGDGDYITLGQVNDLEPGSGDFSAGMWVKIISKNNADFLFSHGYYNSAWYVFAGGGGGGTIRVGVQADIQNCGTTVVGSWSHIVFTKSGTVLTTYLDGFKVTHTTLATVTTTNADMLIGHDSGTSGRNPEMYCDDYRFANRVWSDAEVAAWYNGGRGYTPSLSTGLQGWWCPSRDTAGNGTTTLTDLSGNGNNGTLTNMDAATDWVADTDNGGVRALDFDGQNDYVALPEQTFAGDFAISLWVKPSQLGINEYFVGHSGSVIHGLVIRDDGFRFWIANSQLTFTASTSSGEWHHVAVVRSDGDVNLYWDGVASVSNPIAGSGTLLIDQIARFQASRWATCRVDGLAFWDRALTPAEVTQLYNGGRSLNLFATGTTQSIVPQLLLRRHRMSGGLVI